MKKNDEFEVYIEDMGVGGEGIGKVEGITLFVKDAVIGDTLRVRITKMKKSYGYARLMEVLSPSPYRTKPKCPIARQCGGCQLQALDYKKQLEFKQKKVLGNLQRIGGFHDFKILEEADPPELLMQDKEVWPPGSAGSGANTLPRGSAEGGAAALPPGPAEREAVILPSGSKERDDRNPENPPVIVDPIIGMEDPWHYRNKAQFPVGRGKEGNLVAGFYAGHSHQIIPNRGCPIGAPVNREILDAVLGVMEQYRIEPYDETRGTGLVRHILIRCGFHTGEIMVCLVINGKELPHAEAFIRELKKVTGMTSITISSNTKQTNVIMGETAETLWGKPYITDTIGGISYQISPLSFYQVNPIQTEKLYRTALAYTGLTGEFSLEGTKPPQQLAKTGETESALPPEKIKKTEPALQMETMKETEPILPPGKMKKFGGNRAPVPNDPGKKKTVVWDLYCGIGTISLFLAQHADQVYGVEIVPQAIEDAKRNAAANGITNAEFFIGKAEEILPAFYQQEQEAHESGRAAEVDVIVVDPPRKGCDAGLLETILKIQPQRIVYVSCDSATLARDLKILCADGNYRLERVRVCDQFCHTVHTETVCLLGNRKCAGSEPKPELAQGLGERTGSERSLLDFVNLKPDAYVDLSLDMEDYRRIKAEEADRS